MRVGEKRTSRQSAAVRCCVIIAATVAMLGSSNQVESARAESCAELESQIRAFDQRIAATHGRHTSPVVVREQILRMEARVAAAEMRLAAAARDAAMFDTPGARHALRIVTEWFARAREQLFQLSQEYLTLINASRDLTNQRDRLINRYSMQGCGRLPDGCAPSNSSALRPALPSMLNDPDFSRQVAQTLTNLMVPRGNNGSPFQIVARLNPDGRALDLVTGQAFVNPSDPDSPLRVDFGRGSPFQPGQLVRVGFVPLQTSRGQAVHLARFYDVNNGLSLINTSRGPSRPDLDLPSAWEQFPDGLFLLPSGPAGTLVPISEDGAAVPREIRSILDTVRRLIDAATTGPFRFGPPSASLRQSPDADRGCFAEFQREGIHAVGVNCSSNAPYGRWTWRVVFFGWASAKFTETISRDGSWSTHSEAQVNYHRISQEQLQAMDPIRRGIEQQLKPQFEANYKREIESWQVRMTDRGSRRTLHWRKPGLTNSNGIPNMWRSHLQSGCDRQAPAAYRTE